MKIVENVPINCKIEFGLKVVFAIYQVQCCLLFVCFVSYAALIIHEHATPLRAHYKSMRKR